VSKILDALRLAETESQHGLSRAATEEWAGPRPFDVISVLSNKGGVGKTTVATNLAVYLHALRENDPVLIFGFDDQTTLDRMFALDPSPPEGGIAEGLRAGTLARVARLGQYGVEYVPTCDDLPTLKGLIAEPWELMRVLLASRREGTVVIDTKSDFENLTQAALGVSDLAIVVVKDQASLHEARRVYDWLERERRPIEHARILLSLVDLRVKFHDDEDADVLAHLVGEIRKLGYPLFETFLSRSPKVESLYTNPQGRAYSILQAAHQTVVHRQLHQLAQEVLTAVAQNRRGASSDARQAEGPSAHWIEDGPTAP
jgi:cellulose biosynthesis protein BcsQ